MTADRLRATIRQMIADVSREFSCQGYPRQVFDRIEASLDQIPGGLLRQLAQLDETTNGAVMAAVRGKLVLIAAGALQKKLGALEFFADIAAASPAISPDITSKAAIPPPNPEMQDLPDMRMRGYGRERLDLSPVVVDQILESDYAHLVARPRSIRAALFPQIVSLHTRLDIEQLDGLNTGSIRKLEIWLVRHGTRLRRPCESIDAVICNFKPKGWSRLAAPARSSDLAPLEAAE